MVMKKTLTEYLKQLLHNVQALVLYTPATYLYLTFISSTS